MRLTRADILTVVLAVLVPVGGYLFFFKGRIAELSRLRAEGEQLEQRTSDGGGAATDLAAVRDAFRKMSSRLDAFMGSVTTENEANNAVDAVLRNAKEAGVNIELFRPGKPVAGKQLSCLPIELTALAEFPKLYDFLGRIERDKVVITISKMEPESDPLSGRCSVRLELRVYFVQASWSKESRA